MTGPDRGAANREQIEHWNRHAAGPWVVHQERLDRQIRPHGERALDVLDLSPGERVLDVGCGCGDTTLEIARRLGPRGRVLGVDVSSPMLARARERAREAGLGNVSFLEADAQVADLGEARFDAATSRFGVMFFEDAAAAFRNLARAIRPGGRLCFVCWQAPRENPWVLVPMAAAAPLLALPPPPAPDAPGMFALADAERVRSLLGDAGFARVVVDDLRIPMSPGGGSVEDAARVFLDVGPVAAALREAGDPPELREALLEAVREAFRAHARDGPLSLGSAAWVVQARRG